jgi:hypothetical protein
MENFKYATRYLYISNNYISGSIVFAFSMLLYLKRCSKRVQIATISKKIPSEWVVTSGRCSKV